MIKLTPLPPPAVRAGYYVIEADVDEDLFSREQMIAYAVANLHERLTDEIERLRIILAAIGGRKRELQQLRDEGPPSLSDDEGTPYD